MDILDSYVRETPSPQSVLDLFAGEWSSALPASYGLVTKPGQAGLFEDPRVVWAGEMLGGFAGKSVLELGPLEGGHSFMCQQRGAVRIVAIEANSRAFLKCLCIKEIFDLDRVQFKLGDFNKYLQDCTDRFDVCLASGVLYHSTDPLLSLELMAKASKKLFLWTHYYDSKIIGSKPYLARFFGAAETREYKGRKYVAARKDYKDALDWKGFCGGLDDHAYWLTRESLMDVLRFLGFQDLRIAFDEPDHPNGPALCVSASS